MNCNLKYGAALAHKVVIYLIENKKINYYHKEYCGTGFYFDGQKVYYTHFFDGHPMLEILKNCYNEEYSVIKEFQNLMDFQKWLAEQTDEALSGAESLDEFSRYNQRITEKRLKLLVE